MKQVYTMMHGQKTSKQITPYYNSEGGNILSHNKNSLFGI